MNRLLAALALVVLVGAAGCGNDTDPPPTPSTSAPVSPTKSGPTPPAMPGAAHKQTKAGAIAFVKYYWAVVSYAQESGMTVELKAVQQVGCARCTNGAAWVKRVYRRGGKIVGGRHEVRAASAFVVPGQSDLMIVNATVHGASSQVVGAGNLDRRYPADTFDVRFVLQYGAAGWLVSSWEDA